MTKKSEISEENEKPPFFKSWEQIYLFVAGSLLLLIFVFNLLTQYFSK